MEPSPYMFLRFFLLGMYGRSTLYMFLKSFSFGHAWKYWKIHVLYDFSLGRVVKKLQNTRPEHLFQKTCFQKHAQEKILKKHVCKAIFYTCVRAVFAWGMLIAVNIYMHLGSFYLEHAYRCQHIHVFGEFYLGHVYFCQHIYAAGKVLPATKFSIN